MTGRRENCVFVIDDDDAVRRSLCWLIESADHKAVGFTSAEAFLTTFDYHGVGCVVTDVRMPGVSGIDLLGELSRRGTTLPVVVITAHGEVQMAVQAMKLGAFDFVEKPFEEKALLEVVERALLKCGEHLMAMSTDEDTRKRFESLTPRECEVLKLIVAGKPNRSVAEILAISDKTVEAHRAHIMEKIGAGSFAELVAMAVRVGMPANIPTP
jgi:two-component system, LuxR family, response regulator FixJ